MSFQSPLFLLALLAVPLLLALALSIDRRRAQFPVAFTNLDVLAGVVESAGARGGAGCRSCCFLLALDVRRGRARAAARAPDACPRTTRRSCSLVDVSGSMRANDVEPTRLDAAIAAMRTFLDQLPKRFKVGLVAFSSEPERARRRRRRPRVDPRGARLPPARGGHGDRRRARASR